jgi:alpha-glucosidase
MAQESTQYGLKNKLVLKSFEELHDNHLQLSLVKSVIASAESRRRSSTKQSTQLAYLNIIFLSPKIIRIHYSFNKNFDLKYPNPDLKYEVFDLSQKHYFKIDLSQKSLDIEHGEGKISIQREPLQLSFYDKQGRLIDSDEPSLGFWSSIMTKHEASWQSSDNQEIRCYKQYKDLEKPPMIFGLGDKTGVMDRWTRRFRNAPIDALGYDSEFTDPLYKDIPFFIVRENGNFHGIFFDNFHEKFFDFGRERKPSPYYYFGAKAGELNYYFFYGNSAKEVIANYLELTGRPPEWPEYTYGCLASGMSYTENQEASLQTITSPSLRAEGEAIQSQSNDLLLNTFKRYKQNGIPATAFHLSSGYIQDKEGKRQQFIWNPEKFPDPKRFAETARKEGVELCVNLKPVLLCSHPWYEEAKKLNLFINVIASESEAIQETAAEALCANPLVIDYWGGQGSIMDFRKPATQNWWKEKIKTSFFDNRIFGIWNDNNEYEIFEEHSAHGYEHYMANLMSKLSLEAFFEYKTQTKKLWTNLPWILSRSGYSGIQQYAQTWTGDNYSSWKSLQYDIPLMLSMSISGLIHVGDDIGGFWGGKFNENPNPELLLRWIQFGVFTPRFCIHSYKQTPTEPDMYKDSHPEFFEITQSFMQLRNKLIPEIQTAAKKASEEGIPIMRPTWYDFPEDKNSYEQNFEYIFADKYLIAPIYKANSESKTREIYLPGKDLEWQDYWTGEIYKSEQIISTNTDYSTIPVFTQL